MHHVFTVSLLGVLFKLRASATNCVYGTLFNKIICAVYESTIVFFKHGYCFKFDLVLNFSFCLDDIYCSSKDDVRSRHSHTSLDYR